MDAKFAPLRIVAFRRLLAAYFVGRAGDWFGEVALSVVILHTTNSAFAVALLWMLCSFVPGLMGPFIGPRLRGRRTRRTLVTCAGIEAGLFAMIAVAAAIGLPFELLLALALCDGIISVMARGLTKAAIVCVTRPAGVHQEANALLNVAFTISFAAGPALAGLLVAGVGAPLALALDAASFLFAGLALAGAGSLDATDSASEAAKKRSPVGLSQLWARSRLRSLLIADGLSSVFFALIIPVELVFVTQTLGGSTADFGVVLTAWGVGAVVGGALLIRFARVDGALLLAIAFAAMIGGYLGMGTAGSVAVVIGFSFLGGVGNGIEGGALMTMVQQHSLDHEQADINCMLESMHSGGPGAGYLLGGLLAAAASPRASYIAASLGGLAALVFLAQTLWAVPRARAAPVTA